VVQRAAPPASSPPALVLATTTSARDSSLLDVLIPRFREETGISVDFVAVGTGQALEIGRRGDADLLLTHAPQAEEAFLSEGFAESRAEVFWNDFVILGPANDPAGAWYVSVGEGMAHTLRVAHELQAYTLADRGTWLAQRKRSDLSIVHAGDPRLVNQYAVLVVHPQKHPHRQTAAARKLADFLQAPDTHKLIAEFGREQFGEPLFHTGSAAARRVLVARSPRRHAR
jgi:tungstate transport system substrate-binding protein